MSIEVRSLDHVWIDGEDCGTVANAILTHTSLATEIQAAVVAYNNPNIDDLIVKYQNQLAELQRRGAVVADMLAKAQEESSAIGSAIIATEAKIADLQQQKESQ